MTDRRIHPKDWHRVAEHASVDAIQVYLDTARADRRRLDLQVTRLEQLLAERTGQTAAATPDPVEHIVDVLTAAQYSDLQAAFRRLSWTFRTDVVDTPQDDTAAPEEPTP